jgi:ribosomal protein L12E/L44/L45/RPP1/RPP2
MTTSTPTGNGTGVFMDNSWQSALFSGLDKALNYALLRDQQKMTAVAYNPVAQAQAASQQAAIMQQSRNANLLVLLAVGGLVFLIAKG